jgi:hypothetical protein
MAAVNVNIVLKHTYRANKATFSHQMNLNLNNSYECHDYNNQNHYQPSFCFNDHCDKIQDRSTRTNIITWKPFLTFNNDNDTLITIIQI